MSAITYLQRALLVHDLQTLTGPEWEACFHRVLFPLLTELLQPCNRRDAALMEETRMRAATVLSKVFLHHLTPLLSLSTFANLWLMILNFMDKYMHAEKSDLLYEAIPESLKNMLLVMDSAKVFESPDGRSELWDVTWERIGQFLPNMKEELFREQDEVRALDRINGSKGDSVNLQTNVQDSQAYNLQPQQNYPYNVQQTNLQNPNLPTYQESGSHSNQLPNLLTNSQANLQISPQSNSKLEQPNSQKYQQDNSQVYQQTSVPMYQQTNSPLYQQPNLPSYQQPQYQHPNSQLYQQPNLQTYQPPNLQLYQQPNPQVYQQLNSPKHSQSPQSYSQSSQSTINLTQHNIENATRSSIILQPPSSQNSINSPLFAHLGQVDKYELFTLKHNLFQ